MISWQAVIFAGLSNVRIEPAVTLIDLENAVPSNTEFLFARFK